MIDRSPSRFALVLTAAFIALTVPRLLLHELWRDEAWQWLVVLESRSFGDLFAGLSGGGGVGYGFPMLAYLVAQVSESPRAYQFLHLAVASAAVFVFARYAPFGRRERLLFVLGYLPFYEYVVISRSYAMGVLQLWLVCLAVAGRWRPVLLGVTLGLLVQPTFYSLLLGIAIAGAWVIERWKDRRAASPMRWADGAWVVGLTLVGVVAAFFQFKAKPGISMNPWFLHWDTAHAIDTLRTAWSGFVPVPRVGRNFWNTNLLDPWPVLEAVAGLLVLVAGAAFLRRRTVALVSFVFGAAGLLTFAYVQFPGSVRHHGHLWLLFVAALWMGGGQTMLGDRQSWRSRVLLLLLLVHAGASAFASAMDLGFRFSNGEATAALIRSTGLSRHPLLGHREVPAATISLYLGQPLYAPSRKIFVTHPDWGLEQRELTPREVRCAARDLATREGRDIVMVMNWQLPAWDELDPAGSVTGAIERTEDYWLYWLRHARLETTGDAAACES